ncbi:MAG: hypothetical protein JNL39_05350 [Opitutaceae bacterium]|nr:hypothetical protein [Opitutaceae bacterium]
MADESDPPRKHYQLKPREFERVNERPGESLPGEGTQPINVRDHLRSAAASPAPPGRPHHAADNDVHAMLRANHERRRAAGLEEAPPPPPRRSRRKRDYWLAMGLGNAALIAGLFASPVFAGAGLVIFNTGLTWVMWFVVDDY